LQLRFSFQYVQWLFYMNNFVHIYKEIQKD
jgi:hypothetical protein